MSSHLILIVEEDEATRAFLADQLTCDGYEILLANSRRHALHLLSSHHPQLVLADINGDTLGVIDTIREPTDPGVDPQLPILVLTSHTAELHRTRLLERGADDLLCKPYSYPELRARLGALLRRGTPAARPRCSVPGRCGSMSCPAARGSARSDRTRSRGKEYQLLLTLIAEPERVLTKVNFELPKAEGSQESKYSGSGRDW